MTPSLKVEFTNDDEIEAFQPGDKGMEITGFIDAIDGLKTLNTSQGHVLKFVLNNGSKSRIRILIWGTKDARKYEALIKLRMILHITNGVLKTSHEAFRDYNEKISILEFHVQAFSVITFHGEFTEALALKTEDQYEDVELEDVMLKEGPVQITNAYLKIPFTEAKTANSTYGQGIIVDGFYRLTVQIANFQPNPRMVKGIHLKLRGIMNKQPGGHFRVANDDAIDIIEDGLMTNEQLEASIHSVLLVRTKRPRNSSDSEEKENISFQSS